MTNAKKIRLNADQLRKSEPTEAQIKKIMRMPVYIIVDNILDTYNIGSIFRLADAVAASGVYLCGQSETPPNIRIARASVGTDKWVPWEYKKTVREAIHSIRHSRLDRESTDPRFREDDTKRNVKIIAIEQHAKARDFREVDYALPIAFVVGHETSGVSKDVLRLCDEIVEIPMFGVNISLNVMVSLAIVLYRAI